LVNHLAVLSCYVSKINFFLDMYNYLLMGIFYHHGFFFFLLKWDPFKKNYKFRQVVSIWHDFICTNRHMHKSSQLDTTLSCPTEVVPTWHNFCHVIIFIFILILLFIYWVVSYVMLKTNLIHNFLRVLVLRNKNLDNRVWIMFELNE